MAPFSNFLFCSQNLICITDPTSIQRWKIFAWVINPDTNYQTLMSSCKPTELFLVCQLLIFMNGWKKPILGQKEIQSFILMRLRLDSMTKEAILQIKMDFIPDVNVIQLAWMYTGSIVPFISECLGNVVATKYLLPCNNFQANLFHTIYRDLDKLGLEEIASASEIQELERITTFLHEDN